MTARGGWMGRVRVRRPAVVGAVVGGPAAALYLALGWARFSTGRSGNYDLGIFAQAARDWAAGRLPGSGIRSLDSLFADHFSPVTVLFGVGWRLWPDPRSLLVVQALALGLAVGLVAALAARHLPTPVALAVGATAALAKGLVSAASFDVHETALGAPLVAGLGWALLERRPRLALGCGVALLAVKEDLGLTVAAAGAIWWWLAGRGPGAARGARRTALALVVLGLAGLVVANAVVVWVSPDHRSPYLQFLLGASGNPQGLAGAQVEGGSRWAPTLLFVLAAGVAGLRSPIAALALPTLAWRAASSNASYWQTYFHYDAVLVPVAAIALVDVLRRWPPAAVRWRRAGTAVVAGALAWSAAIGLAKVAAWRPWDPARLRPVALMRDAAALGDLVPVGEAVVAQQDLGPAVLARLDVRMLTDSVPATGRWVLLTPSGNRLGAPQAAKQRWLDAVRERPGVEVFERGECVLVRLPAVEPVEL